MQRESNLLPKVSGEVKHGRDADAGADEHDGPVRMIAGSKHSKGGADLHVVADADRVVEERRHHPTRVSLYRALQGIRARGAGDGVVAGRCQTIAVRIDFDRHELPCVKGIRICGALEGKLLDSIRARRRPRQKQ